MYPATKKHCRVNNIAKPAGVLRALCLVLAAAIGGCGGGGGGGGGSPTPVVSNPPPPAGDEPVGGVWYGDLDVVGQDGWVEGLVASDGSAYFSNVVCECEGESPLQVMFWGELESSGRQVTGEFTAAGSFPDGAIEGRARLAGVIEGVATATTARTMTGTVVFTSSLGATYTASLRIEYDRNYEWPSFLERIAGIYRDGSGTYSRAMLDIAADGSLFLQDAASGCVINGQVSILDGRYSVYGVELTHSGCGGDFAGLNGVLHQGLAHYDSYSLQVWTVGEGTPSPRSLRMLFFRN